MAKRDLTLADTKLPLSPSHALKFLRDILKQLQELHGQGRGFGTIYLSDVRIFPREGFVPPHECRVQEHLAKPLKGDGYVLDMVSAIEVFEVMLFEHDPYLAEDGGRKCSHAVVYPRNQSREADSLLTSIFSADFKNLISELRNRKKTKGKLSPSSLLKVLDNYYGRLPSVRRLGGGSEGEVLAFNFNHGEKVMAVKVMRFGSVPAASRAVRHTKKLEKRIGRHGYLASPFHVYMSLHPPNRNVVDFALQATLSRVEEHHKTVYGYHVMDLAETDLTGIKLPVDSIVALEITKQILKGLAYLHSSDVRVVHGDIKPHNILLFPHSVFKLGDFDLSECLEDVRPDVIAGTYGYIAPEVGIPVDRSLLYKRDIFALGMSLLGIIGHGAQKDRLVAGKKVEIPTIDAYLGIFMGGGKRRRETTRPAVMNLISQLIDKDPARRPSARRALQLVSDLLHQLKS